MNQLPINKIFVAGFAFAIVHWKKIVEISIIPVLFFLPLLMLMPELMTLVEQMFVNKLFESVTLPENIGIYSVLFLYGIISLYINLYRLVVLGGESVSIFPVLDFTKIVRFIALTLLVGFVNIVPLILNNSLWLSLLMSFLVVPITLNFVNIAIGNPLKYRWGLSFPTHMNLFFLQVIVPRLIIFMFVYLPSIIGLNIGMKWMVMVLTFYWGSITLALCYQLINTSDT